MKQKAAIFEILEDDMEDFMAWCGENGRNEAVRQLLDWNLESVQKVAGHA